MMDHESSKPVLWSLGWLFGSENSLFLLTKSTIINTWIVLAIIFAISFPIKWIMRRKNSIIRYMVISFIKSFVNLCNQSLPRFSLTHFSFITSLFIFILICNILSIIPTLDEPTVDLNTTLALGFISFFYAQIYAIKEHGVLNYIKEYFSPFFIMFPLHVVGKIASIISISFRLFGNIFGGAVIAGLFTSSIAGNLILELFNIFSATGLVITIFFTLFEGGLQAFVFSMLTLTYLSIAVQGEGE